MNPEPPKLESDPDDLISFLAYAYVFGNEKALAVRNKGFIDKGLRELAEFKETITSNRGGYPLTDYSFNNDIGVCINGAKFITNHIRIVEVSYNSHKLKIFKNFEKRQHTPFKLEDIETLSIFKVNKTKQTVLMGFKE